MTKAGYKQLRKKLLSMIDETVAKRDAEFAKRDQEIARLQKLIDEIDAMYSDDEIDGPHDNKSVLALMIDKQPGITDGIRTVLSRKYPGWLTPLRVRSELAMLGMPLDRIANPMASVHAILKRFESRGWIEPKTADGETLYRWIPVEKRKKVKA